MRRFTMVVGVTLVCGAPIAPLTLDAAQQTSATRAQPFHRLETPRVEGATCDASSEVCRAFNEFNRRFRKPTAVPERDKELVVLRTGWLSRANVVWARHAAYAREAGLTDEDISRVTVGPDAPGWNPFDATLLKAADELHVSRFISDRTWNALGQRYTNEQRLEVVMIVALYTQLAMYQNTIGMQLRPGETGLPD